MHSQQLARTNRALRRAIVDSEQMQGRIAKRARIEPTRMSKLVHGKAKVTPRERNALARVLKVAPDVLFPPPAQDDAVSR